VSGVDKVLFWVTSYLSDLINYLIPFTLIFICFAAFNQDVFTVRLGRERFHHSARVCDAYFLPIGRMSGVRTVSKPRPFP
jgi:hypothetical protein